jgi:hypothetical protein
MTERQQMLHWLIGKLKGVDPFSEKWEEAASDVVSETESRHPNSNAGRWIARNFPESVAGDRKLKRFIADARYIAQDRML